MVDVTLSILMATYNAALYLEEAIDGICEQSFTDWELLVCDDGSTDETLEILDKYRTNTKIKIFSNAENLGKTETVNSLYKRATGIFLSIHDADDISYGNRFLRQIEWMTLHPEYVMCGCSFQSFTKEGFRQESIMEKRFEVIRENIVKHSHFHGPTMVIRKAVVDQQLGGEFLRPFFRDYNEDCDLAIRLVEQGKCTNLQEVLYNYRIQANSLSKSITPRKKCMYPMLVHFHRQRIKRGLDDLQAGDTGLAKRKLRYLQHLCYSEKSKIHREAAAFFMHYRLFSSAIWSALKSVRYGPGSLKNWRTLQYCLRKSILGI